MSSIRYRPEIDGLRAVAVIPVILFHLKSSWLQGGFLGVDVFFVISGFLITSIILREHEAGEFSFRSFWSRRAKRILPVLITVVLASVAAVHLIVFKGEYQPMGGQGVAALLSFANIAMWRMTGNYWGPQAESSPFLHAWSLSVEEQFYLLFPAALILLLKYKPKWLTQAAFWLATLGFVGFLYGAKNYPTASFYLLPTRAWELASGCLLAVVVRRHSTALAQIPMRPHLALGGLLLVVASYFLLAGGSGFSGALVIPVVGAVMIIAFGMSGPAHVFLTLAPVVYIGKISYSLYLWHWPAIVFARHIGYYPKTTAVLVTVLASVASYHLIEKPVRTAKRPMLPIMGGFAVALACCLQLAVSNGTYDVSRFSPTVWKGFHYDVTPRQNKTSELQRLMSTVNAPPRDPGMESAFVNGGIIRQHGGSVPQVVVLGDSHGAMWSGQVDDISGELGLTAAFYVMNGVNPFLKIPVARNPSDSNLTSDERFLYDTKRLEFIRKWHPEIVVISAYWPDYSKEDVMDLFKVVSESARQVLVMEQPPELQTGNMNPGEYLCFKGVLPPVNGKFYMPQGDRVGHANGVRLIQAVAKEFDNVTIVPVADRFLGPNNDVLVLEGRDVLYLDDDHLDEAGTARLHDRLKQSMVAAHTASVEPAEMAGKTRVAESRRAGDRHADDRGFRHRSRWANRYW